MKRIIFVVLVFVFLDGCGNKEIVSEINEAEYISINYPVTGINILDNEISSYVNKTYSEFKKKYKDYKKPELNISYTYKELNLDIINVGINTEICVGNTYNRIKTFTYDKKRKRFLTMENLVKDLDILDYDIKKELLLKYMDADMDYLSRVSLDNYTIDDENLTIYFNSVDIKNNGDEVLYLDIPLNSLKLLIDIDRSNNNDVYLNIKKRNLDFDDKVVALTFDDGPSKYTNGILDILDKNGAVGTFFVVGNKVDFYDDVLVKMVKNGNEIGNHSYSHKLLTRLSEEEFKSEISKTQDEVKKATGYTPKLFRPTYGGYTSRLRSYTDLYFVLWDVDSRDWKVHDKDKIINNIIPNVKSGSIVLMHDNHGYALEALEDIIKELDNDGYKFVTVSELLELQKIRDS